MDESKNPSEIRPVTADAIRRNEQRFFGSAGANPRTIATQIGEGALVLGARRVLIAEEDDWWFVCADADWLAVRSVQDFDAKTVFDTTWGFPELGVNSHRSEALARVFGRDVVSIAGDDVHVVKGEAPAETELRARLARLGGWPRVVAFRF